MSLQDRPLHASEYNQHEASRKLRVKINNFTKREPEKVTASQETATDKEGHEVSKKTELRRRGKHNKVNSG